MANKQISRTISVPADSTTTVYTNSLVSPICVSAVPSEGGSAKVYFTISQKSKVDADEANWFEWGKGGGDIGGCGRSAGTRYRSATTGY